MLRSLARAVLLRGQISTTVIRAKATVPLVDKIMNLARRGDLAARRQAVSILADPQVIGLVFRRYGKTPARPGTFCRLIKVGRRLGDATPVARLILLAEAAAAPAKAEKKPEKKTEKK